MLHIAFRKLMASASQQMLTQASRIGVDHRHRILQLVAESVCAAGLIVAAAGDETAGDGLVKQPPIGEYVDSWIGCFYLHRAQQMLPMCMHALQCRFGSLVAAMLTGDSQCVGFAATHAQPEHQFVLAVDVQVDEYLDRRAWVQPCSTSPR